MLLKPSAFLPNRSGAVRLACIILAISSLGLLVHLYWDPSYSQHFSFETSNPDPPVSLLERQRSFFSVFQPLLEKYAPICPSPTRDEGIGAVGFPVADDFQRPDLVHMSDYDVATMREAHAGFVQELLAKYESGEFTQMYVPGSRGVVSTAGGSYLPIFMSSLRMLRRTGSNLPVELFLKDKTEYEENICEKVLPSLNAKCIVLDDILNGGINTGRASFEIAHYQLKIFAMLFSSFEEMMWIDADCFPLHKPQLLFESEPFLSTGMVIWPDFWANTVSPKFYDIAQRVPPPMNLRASSETGEMMISKRSHRLTLMLATYYNYYGPSHYFMLLSQGAPGEGDKDTFVAAASAVNESFYHVAYPVRPIGHPKPDGDTSGSAMTQANPIEDMALKPYSDPKNDPDPPSIFFIHAHYPKFNPATIFGTGFETAPTVGPYGGDGRAWTYPEPVIRRFGYDAEFNYWEEIQWVACTLENDFASWRGRSGICDRVKRYRANVFDNEGDSKPDFGTGGMR